MNETQAMHTTNAIVELIYAQMYYVLAAPGDAKRDATSKLSEVQNNLYLALQKED